MKELTVQELQQVSGGRMPVWGAALVTGLAAAGGAFIGIAGGPVGVGIGATLGAAAGGAIVELAN